jgi:hypothetical protein
VNGQPDNEEPRPWEHPGSFRRDCEPYLGYLTNILAWSGAGCVIFTPLAPVGLVLGLMAWRYARRDIGRIVQGLLEPGGMKSANNALGLAKAVVLVGVVSSLSLAILVLTLVVAAR